MFWLHILRFAFLVLVAAVVGGPNISYNFYLDKFSSIHNKLFSYNNDTWQFGKKIQLPFYKYNTKGRAQQQHNWWENSNPTWNENSDLLKTRKNKELFNFQTHNKRYKKFNNEDADKEEYTKNNLSYNGTIQKLFSNKNEPLKIPNQGYIIQNDIPAVTHGNKQMYQYLGNWIMNTLKQYLDFFGSDHINPEKYNYDYRLDQRPSDRSSSELRKIDVPVKYQSIYKHNNNNENSNETEIEIETRSHLVKHKNWTTLENEENAFVVLNRLRRSLFSFHSRKKSMNERFHDFIKSVINEMAKERSITSITYTRSTPTEISTTVTPLKKTPPKIDVHSMFPCDCAISCSDTQTSGFNRQTENSLIFPLEVINENGVPFQNYDTLEDRLETLFKDLQKPNGFEINITSDESPENIESGDRELQISPITDMDVELNSFKVSVLEPVTRNTDNPTRVKVGSIIYRIDLSPIDDEETFTETPTDEEKTLTSTFQQESRFLLFNKGRMINRCNIMQRCNHYDMCVIQSHTDNYLFCVDIVNNYI
ncbi:uncharacterized protein LOC143231469 [Tachypleus tridentatus]|uniref:uncharacterized protein LOC143231469 n=1 Tax=Tachypleus tridentatus TaxID=6853 RepID=UPI003FCEE666